MLAVVLIVSINGVLSFDKQRVVQLLQRLGFMLSLEKCQLELTQEFTHLVLVFSIQNVTFSMSQDNALTIKTQVAKVASSPSSRV